MATWATVTQLNQLASRITLLETEVNHMAATAQEILDLATQASTQLDSIAGKLASQISPAEATAIRDALAALVTKATQLAS